jgi:hypothetical protein
MKTTLILSVLAAMCVASTTSFAQDYVTYSNAYGNAQRTISSTAPTAMVIRQLEQRPMRLNHGLAGLHLSPEGRGGAGLPQAHRNPL